MHNWHKQWPSNQGDLNSNDMGEVGAVYYSGVHDYCWYTLCVSHVIIIDCKKIETGQGSDSFNGITFMQNNIKDGQLVQKLNGSHKNK